MTGSQSEQSDFMTCVETGHMTCCVGLLTFLSDHQTYCPANSNITLARGAGPLWSHQLHICCFNNNKHTKKFVIIDQFDVKWRCWEALQHWIWDLGLVLNRHRILNLVILVTSSSNPVLAVWSEQCNQQQKENSHSTSTTSNTNTTSTVVPPPAPPLM